MRVRFLSPNVHVDDTWRAVKKYTTDIMTVDTIQEKENSEEYDALALKHIREHTHTHKVIDFQKKNKQKELFSISIVADDFADDAIFERYSNILHGLFTRGRDNAISCILSTLKIECLGPYNSLGIDFLFNLKNMKVHSLEENSAFEDKRLTL